MSVFIKIILSFLLVIALGVAGYFGYMYYQQNQQPSPTNEQVTIIPSDPTEDWETYVNPTLNISFKIPDTLSVKETNTPQNFHEEAVVTLSTTDLYKSSKIKPCKSE